MRIPLHKRIFLNFVLVIALFGVLGAVLSAVLINRTTLDEAQRRVSLDLRSAWDVLHNEMDRLQLFVTVLSTGKRVDDAFAIPDSPANRVALEQVRRQCGLDFLALTDSKGQVLVRSLEPYKTGDILSNDPFVSGALKGETRKGLALLSQQRLRDEGGNLEERAFMVFEPTPKSKVRAKTSESAGMALVAAAPVLDEGGKVIGALYAGLLLNRNHGLVDKIRSIVFENKTYQGQPLGTVTIFQWDCRVATNVILANGNRAIGTRVSEEVYDKVLENGLNWYDRAFVVKDWYLSAYDPIHDIHGKVVGILYVGVLAKQYDDLKWDLWKLYGAISGGVGIFVLAIGLIFARRLTGSISRLAEAAGKIGSGNLDLNVKEPKADDEVKDLTQAFNLMTASLKERDEKLRTTYSALEQSNKSLEEMNRNYLDMLGFVSHELKNTLGVIYTSARALDAGIVGTLSDAQAALARNIAKSIDGAVRMTRNYLDLARIEKGELRVIPKVMEMIGEIIDPLLEELKPVIDQQGVTIEKRLPGAIVLKGDTALLKIAYRNLLDNALKYGRKGGRIRLGFEEKNGALHFEVWNEGKGLTAEQIARLFEKFVRFESHAEATRSTGLGLFITREIIMKHKGEILAESEPGQWMRFRFTLPLATPTHGLEEKGEGKEAPKEESHDKKEGAGH
ncbi:MAG: HAMP domain-containing protein [Deltaproteobacteria bacterium]|jgi:two-component system NtrC family sensor kinase|nr:HAMP domain-containing protein [Deltaproteobacteria bacterium]